jgi:hypothetical protein
LFPNTLQVTPSGAMEVLCPSTKRIIGSSQWVLWRNWSFLGINCRDSQSTNKTSIINVFFAFFITYRVCIESPDFLSLRVGSSNRITR